MYIHLGKDVLIRKSEIIGIFDIDKTTISKKTRDFLEKNEKEKKVINVSMELPKSFVVTKDKVYISQISPQTLLKRADFFKNL